MGVPIGKDGQPLEVVSSLTNMQVGQCIPCKYTVATSGTVGTFSELGVDTGTEIPTTGIAVPNATNGNKFYLTKVDKGLCIADRVVQNSVSWDTLNAGKMIEGSSNSIILPWLTVDTSSLQYSQTKSIEQSDSVTFNNELYCVFSESNGTVNQIRVKKYNGTTWSWVDGGGTNGINYDVTKNTSKPKIIIYNNNIYCSWIETSSNGNDQLRVKKYNGTTWSWVDGGGTNGINYDVTRGANYSNMYIYNNELYCNWSEIDSTITNQVRVKKYNGTTWSWVDGGGVGGINYSTTKSGTKASLTVYNNELYCTWVEMNASSVYQIRIKKYNGTTWSFVDGGGANGLNYDVTKSIDSVKSITYNNELYCTWVEPNASSVYQIRIKKYNGTTWSFVDGGGANGINYLVTKDALNVGLNIYNSELYTSWNEYNANSIGQIRVKKYNGSTWTWVDGGGVNGLNYDVTKTVSNFNLTVYNNNFYSAWKENDGTVNLLRFKKLPTTIIRSLSGGNSYADYSNKRIVLSLLHGEGTYTDSAPMPRWWSANGGAMVKADNYKFGSSAMYFDGVDDYIETYGSTDLNLSTNDFSIDFWIKRSRIGILERIMGQCDSSITSTTVSFYLTIRADNSIFFNVGYGSSTLTMDSLFNTIADTNWHHIACTRYGTNLYLYVDGVQWGTASIGTNALNSSTNRFTIGRNGEYTSNYFQGYIDEFRFIKYKSEFPTIAPTTFTPPTEAYTDTNCSLLLHMDGTDGSTSFVDSSSSNKTVILNGTPTIKTDNYKFGGSSGYFNGTTDCVSFDANADFNFGAGNFAIDFWVKRERSGITEYPIGQNDDVSSTTSMSFSFAFNSTNNLLFRIAYSSNAIQIVSTNTIADTNWHHIVGARVGTNSYLYVDGVQWGTDTTIGTNALNSSTNKLAIGRGGERTINGYFQGYIDEVRIIKGIIPDYLKNFVPPIVAYNETNTLEGAFNGGTVNTGLGAYPENEWDKYIWQSNLKGKIISNDSNVWHHFNTIRNWCKDTPINAISTNTNRIGRTYDGMNTVSFATSNTADGNRGFRPVLEYVDESVVASRRPTSVFS